MITLGTYLERSPVHKFGGARIPGPARRAAAQRVDGYNDLVARLKRSTRPAVPGHQARCPAFKIPDRRAAVWPFDLQQEIRVRIGVLELLHGADQFDRMVLIEHGKRVVCHERAAACNQRTAHDECSQLPPHSTLPVDVVEPAICRSRVAAQATHMSVGYEYRMDRQIKAVGRPGTRPPLACLPSVRARAQRQYHDYAAKNGNDLAPSQIEHGVPPEPVVPAYRTIRLTRKHLQVLGADLNRSESRWRRPS